MLTAVNGDVRCFYNPSALNHGHHQTGSYMSYSTDDFRYSRAAGNIQRIREQIARFRGARRPVTGIDVDKILEDIWD